MVSNLVMEHSVSRAMIFQLNLYDSRVPCVQRYMDCDEVLECKREPGNFSDPYAVAKLKEITGADTVAGYVPRSISSICSRRGGSIASRVNGYRRYSSDLPQGGLKIPCVLIFSETFSAKSNNESDKVRKLLESMLPMMVQSCLMSR